MSELFGASDRSCGVLEMAFEMAGPHVEATTNVSAKFDQSASEFKVRVPDGVDHANVLRKRRSSLHDH